MCRRECTTPAFIAVLTLSLALTASVVSAQQPKPADEPPPRLEGSAQAALLATTGNASAESLGFGGDIVWRPLPWMLRAKGVFDFCHPARPSSDSTTSCAICSRV